MDVNTALVPASLRAIASLSKEGIIDAKYEANATAFAQVWEAQAPGFFEVQVNASSASARLDNFVASTGLSSPVLGTNATKSDVSFLALSLMADGSPVEVRVSFTT